MNNLIKVTIEDAWDLKDKIKIEVIVKVKLDSRDEEAIYRQWNRQQ